MKAQFFSALLPAVIAAFGLAGCKSDNDVSYNAIAHDLSPEMQGTVERPVDIDKNINITSDINSRMFSDDLGRVFYTDHPSRLSPLPISGVSGSPR